MYILFRKCLFSTIELFQNITNLKVYTFFFVKVNKMGRKKLPQIRIDETKKQDIKYVFSYFKRQNNVKKHPLSINQIYKKVAEILHVSRCSVLLQRKRQSCKRG